MSETTFYQIRCVKCHKQYDEKENSTWCQKCNEPLEIKYDYAFIKRRLNTYSLKHSPISSLKYLALYPIHNLERIISLNEGGTPLIHARNIGKKLGLNNLYIKNEGANPTGVFKDRGTMVEVTKALEVGAKAVCLASTGNMAASVAAYSSLAGIPCYVLVPEGTAVGKLSQTLSYGARVIQIRGTYSDCARLAEKMAPRHNFYLAGDYIFRLEGQKSQAYEIIEQLYWQVPDYILCPVGCGTNFSAIWQGFLDYKELGLIDKLPQLIAVQATGCAPVAEAALKRSLKFKPVDKPSTVCGAIAAGNPLDGHKILKAIKDSQGTAVMVDDNEALEAGQELARQEAVFTEVSGAIPIAALHQLKHKFKPTDKIVCIATGNGLKDPLTPLKILPDPPSLEPEIKEIDKYIKSKLYLITAAKAKDRIKVLWKKTPDNKQIKDITFKEFNFKLSSEMVSRVHKISRSFEKKGKPMTKTDFQNVLEETLNEFSLKDKVLRIEDFRITDSIHDKAQAEVDFEYLGKKYQKVKGGGDGVVDAIVKALKKGMGREFIKFSLIDYQVGISTEGENAVTKVKITLEDNKQNKVVATSTSPDVLVASVYAFEKGYNILYWKNT